MKQNHYVSCDKCGFASLCKAYLFDKQDPFFLRCFSQKKAIAKGEYIYQHGMPANAIFALRSGFAKIYDREKKLQGLVLPGQVIGSDDLMTDYYHYDVQAACNLEVCELLNANFYQLSQSTSTFIPFILHILSRSAREKQQFISVLVQSNGLQKILAFLKLLSAHHLTYGLGQGSISLPLTNNELAGLLGLSPSTLARSLDILVQQGVIIINKKEVILLEETLVN